MIKKGILFLAVSAALILVSGCETLNAIDAGDIKIQDLTSLKIREFDAWMRENLW